MANEIQIRVHLSVANGNLSDTTNITYNVDQTAVGGPTPGYVTIGTTEESVAFGELGTKGIVFIQNLDPTNFIDWGFSTGVYGSAIPAGETAGPFRLKSGTTLYLKADTAACKCLIKGFEA